MLSEISLGIYPTCISFTEQLGNHTNSYLALNSVASGFGQMIGKYSWLVSKVDIHSAILNNQILSEIVYRVEEKRKTNSV